MRFNKLVSVLMEGLNSSSVDVYFIVYLDLNPYNPKIEVLANNRKEMIPFSTLSSSGDVMGHGGIPPLKFTSVDGAKNVLATINYDERKLYVKSLAELSGINTGFQFRQNAAG